MDSLPSVVLRSIIIQVKHQEQGRQNDLLACSRVNRAWHNATIPILHGIIALDIPLLKHFAERFPIDKYGGCIRSFTVRLEGDESLERRPSGYQVPHPELRERLQNLAPMVRKMNKLASFSLVRRVSEYYFVARQDLSALLDWLPATCTSLEIDTQGADRCTCQGEEEEEEATLCHVCPSIRRLMPQIMHLRLRMKTMCPAMFHNGVDGSDGQDIPPKSLSADGFVSMPAIRSLLMICGKAFGPSYDRCCVGNPPWHWEDPIRYAYATVVETVQRMVDVSKWRDNDLSDTGRYKDSPPSAWLRDASNVKLLVIGHGYHENNNDTRWAPVVRTDILKEEAWASPIRMIWTGGLGDGWVVRLPDGREFVGTSDRVQDLAADEEDNWLDLWNGARLPRRVVLAGEDRILGADEAQTAVAQTSVLTELCGGLSGVRPDEPSLKTREEWQKTYPRQSAIHWKKEDTSGQRVISAERRVGREDYTSLRLVHEVIPEGQE